MAGLSKGAVILKIQCMLFLLSSFFVFLSTEYVYAYDCEVGGKQVDVAIPCDQYFKLFPEKPKNKITPNEVWKAKRDARQKIIDDEKALKKRLAEAAAIDAEREVLAGPPMQQTVEEYCIYKWTKRGELNSRMYSHCKGNQREAYVELRRIKKDYSSQKYFKAISLPYCEKKWIDKGVADSVMIVHCLENEIEGAKDLAYYLEKFGASRVNPIANKALGRYGSMNMVGYELEKHLGK